MKKTLVSLIVLIFALTMMTGGAWAASELDIAAAGAGVPDTPDVDADPSGPFVVGSEWLAGQSGAVTVDLGNALPAPGGVAAYRSDILYVPNINIATGNTIRITVANGALLGNVNYGLNDGVGSIAILTDATDGTGSLSTGYTSILLQFTTDVDADTVLFLVPDNTAVPGAGNAPSLLFTNTGLSSAMTLQVTAAFDTNGQPLQAPKTAAETVAKAIPQLSASVQHLVGAAYSDGVATSVINVEAVPSRTKFVSEGAGEDTPDATTSQAAILVASATVNNGIIVADAAYTITLNSNQDAIDNVALEGDDFTEAADSWSITSDFATNDLTAAGSNDVIITLEGTVVVSTDDYTVDLVIDPAEANVANQQSLDNEAAFNWSINAMQAKIPYIAVQVSGYLSFIKVAVEGSNPADLSVDAVINNVTDGVVTTQSAVPIKSLLGPSLETVSEAELVTALGLEAGKIYHLELTLTVVAPQNTVQVSAFQKDPVGRTVIPVLYNTNNPNDGRKWQ